MAGEMRGGYRGAEWAPVHKGVCQRHKITVGPLGVCLSCHLDQLQAARDNAPATMMPEPVAPAGFVPVAL